MIGAPVAEAVAADAAADRRLPVPGSPGHRRRALLTAVLTILCAGALVALVALFVVASKHAYGGNSDDATLLLEGKSIAGGNIGLHGWRLSYDAFWTVDAPLYALAAFLGGLRPDLLNIVPAAVMGLLLAVSAVLALDRRRDKAALVGVALVVALLAFPGPDLAYYFLQAGWHSVTALWCLIVFVGVSRAGSKRWAVAAAVFVAAGLLGDLLTLSWVFGPVMLSGALAARRSGSWRSARRHAWILGAGAILAVVTRIVASALGAYSIGRRSILAIPSEMVRNVAILPSRLLAYFGVTGVVGGLSRTPLPLRVAHFLLFVVVLTAVVGAMWRVGRGYRRGTADTEGARTELALDDLLAIAFLCDLVSFVLFATEDVSPLARYLVPGYVFAAILGGRAVGRWVRARSAADELPRAGVHRLRSYFAVAVVLTALCATDFGLDSLGKAAPQPTAKLAAFLEQRGLTSGIGDYWSSSLVTVESSGRVAVRPVDLAPDGKLVSYTKQSDDSWYESVGFQFFVYDTGNNWHGVVAGPAVATFGRPEVTYSVGTYRVLVWSRPVHVSP